MKNNETTIFQKNRIRSAIRSMLCELEPTYFVTANFNREMTFEGARRCLRHWHACVDRARLGTKWSKKPAANRIFFVAFPEHPDTNLHYHLLLRAPLLPEHPVFKSMASGAWEKVVKGGSLDVQELKTELDVARVSSYSTKDLWNERLLEQWIVSSEFLT